MGDCKWKDAYSYFIQAGTYYNADRLAEYCLWMHVEEAHPDLVPCMGINDILETIGDENG